MIVVSDTSPLNYLILIGLDHVLPTLYERVVTPPAVIREMLHPRTPAKVSAWAATPPSWLEVISPTAIDTSLALGAGETEAISLALELNPELILIDEREATQTAKGRGLTVAGTINVLAHAAALHLLDLTKAFTDLRQTNFRGPEALMDELLLKDAARNQSRPK